jgi:selenide,water dikinase
MDPAVLDLMLKGIPKFSDPNVLVGFGHKDDAAVYRLPSGERLVQTVDYFTPVVDDPYDYGQIAAANSLSDVYAMGGRPLFALNIACFPKSQAPDIWREVLRGGAEKAAEAGIAVIGGHTVDDEEPKYGLVVTGLIEREKFWSNEGARVGDQLILTKRLGTGLLTTLLKAGTVSAVDIHEAVASMKMLNRVACEVLSEFDVSSCTDITGNGLLGHAWEICEASGVGMEIDAQRVPYFELALHHADSGKFPGGTKANRLYLGDNIHISESVSPSMAWLLFDAQTSGGLLACMRADQADTALAKLHARGVPAATIIGRVQSEQRIQIS